MSVIFAKYYEHCRVRSGDDVMVDGVMLSHRDTIDAHVRGQAFIAKKSYLLYILKIPPFFVLVQRENWDRKCSSIRQMLKREQQQ